ncbi:hypothetical protein T484DRAFT_1777263, partial [Baffinella frigidus]
MTITTFQPRPGNFCKTPSSINDYLLCDSSIASAARASHEEEQMHVPTIASRRRRTAPPALNITSLQPAQPFAVKKPSTLPRVLSTKRPTIKEMTRHPTDFPTLSATTKVAPMMPVSMNWLDRLEVSIEKPAKDSR